MNFSSDNDEIDYDKLIEYELSCLKDDEDDEEVFLKNDITEEDSYDVVLEKISEAHEEFYKECFHNATFDDDDDDDDEVKKDKLNNSSDNRTMKILHSFNITYDEFITTLPKIKNEFEKSDNPTAFLDNENSDINDVTDAWRSHEKIINEINNEKWNQYDKFYNKYDERCKSARLMANKQLEDQMLEEKKRLGILQNNLESELSLLEQRWKLAEAENKLKIMEINAEIEEEKKIMVKLQNDVKEVINNRHHRAALMIQKVFRAYRIRKRIGAQIDEVREKAKKTLFNKKLIMLEKETQKKRAIELRKWRRDRDKEQKMKAGNEIILKENIFKEKLFNENDSTINMKNNSDLSLKVLECEEFESPQVMTVESERGVLENVTRFDNESIKSEIIVENETKSLEIDEVVLQGDMSFKTDMIGNQENNNNNVFIDLSENKEVQEKLNNFENQDNIAVYFDKEFINNIIPVVESKEDKREMEVNVVKISEDYDITNHESNNIVDMELIDPEDVKKSENGLDVQVLNMLTETETNKKVEKDKNEENINSSEKKVKCDDNGSHEQLPNEFNEIRREGIHEDNTIKQSEECLINISNDCIISSSEVNMVKDDLENIKDISNEKISMLENPKRNKENVKKQNKINMDIETHNNVQKSINKESDFKRIENGINENKNKMFSKGSKKNNYKEKSQDDIQKDNSIKQIGECPFNVSHHSITDSSEVNMLKDDLEDDKNMSNENISMLESPQRNKENAKKHIKINMDILQESKDKASDFKVNEDEIKENKDKNLFKDSKKKNSKETSQHDIQHAELKLDADLLKDTEKNKDNNESNSFGNKSNVEDIVRKEEFNEKKIYIKKMEEKHKENPKELSNVSVEVELNEIFSNNIVLVQLCLTWLIYKRNKKEMECHQNLFQETSKVLLNVPRHIYQNSNFLQGLENVTFEPNTETIESCKCLMIKDEKFISVEGMVEKCPNVQYLAINNTSLRFINSKDLVESLVYLNLDTNKLEWLYFGNGKSHNLVSISCHANDLADLPPGAFRNCESLSILDLSNNNFLNIDNIFKECSPLTKLCCLNLSGNMLSNMETLPYYCPQLTHINMSNNHVKSWRSDDNFPAMVKCDLSCNSISKIGRILDSPFLIQVDLSSNSIDTLEEFVTSWLPCLSDLNLDSNKLTKIPQLPFPLLQTFSLKKNCIEDLFNVEDVFKACPLISTIDLRQNIGRIGSLNKFEGKIINDTNIPITVTIPCPSGEFEMMCFDFADSIKSRSIILDKNIKSSSSIDVSYKHQFHFYRFVYEAVEEMSDWMMSFLHQRNSSTVNNIINEENFISDGKKEGVAATIIQALWKGYKVQKWFKTVLKNIKFETDKSFEKFVPLDIAEFDENYFLGDWDNNYQVSAEPKEAWSASNCNLKNIEPISHEKKQEFSADGNLLILPSSRSSSTQYGHSVTVGKKDMEIMKEWGFEDPNSAKWMQRRAKRLKGKSEKSIKSSGSKITNDNHSHIIQTQRPIKIAQPEEAPISKVTLQPPSSAHSNNSKAKIFEWLLDSDTSLVSGVRNKSFLPVIENETLMSKINMNSNRRDSSSTKLPPIKTTFMNQ